MRIRILDSLLTTLLLHRIRSFRRVSDRFLMNLLEVRQSWGLQQRQVLLRHVLWNFLKSELSGCTLHTRGLYMQICTRIRLISLHIASTWLSPDFWFWSWFSVKDPHAWWRPKDLKARSISHNLALDMCLMARGMPSTFFWPDFVSMLVRKLHLSLLQ